MNTVSFWRTPKRSNRLRQLICCQISTVFTKGQSMRRHLLQFLIMNIDYYSPLPKTSNLTPPKLMRNTAKPEAKTISPVRSGNASHMERLQDMEHMLIETSGVVTYILGTLDG